MISADNQIVVYRTKRVRAYMSGQLLHTFLRRLAQYVPNELGRQRQWNVLVCVEHRAWNTNRQRYWWNINIIIVVVIDIIIIIDGVHLKWNEKCVQLY